MPFQQDKLRLATNLPATAVWSSPTLQLEAGSPEPLAVLVPGTHLLIATDPRNGSTRQVTIRVEEL